MMMTKMMMMTMLMMMMILLYTVTKVTIYVGNNSSFVKISLK